MNLALVSHNNHHLQKTEGTMTSSRTSKDSSMYMASPKLKKLIGMSNMGRFSKSFDHTNTTSRNSLQFEAHTSPRVPEIKMINQLYGLVPKKFIINERVRPETAAAPLVNIRSRSRVRPVTTNTAASKVKYTKSGHRLLINSRQGSLDSGKGNSETLSHSEDDPPDMTTMKFNGGSFSASCTPLITRRMSFEKGYLKSFRHSKHIIVADTTSTVADTKNSSEDKQQAKQRVIHIDLNRMRWTDDDHDTNSADEAVKPPADTNETVVQEKPEGNHETKSSSSLKRSKSLRKTISFDEDTLRADEKEVKKDSCDKKSKRPSTAKHGMTKNTDAPSLSTDEVRLAGQATPALPPLNTEDPAAAPPAPWTAGKTTAERRAKFHKSFSIHPSMEASFDSCLGFGIESEGETTSNVDHPEYPASMKRTGRRSLHVESFNDDVDTLLSTAKTKTKDRSTDHNGCGAIDNGIRQNALNFGAASSSFSRSMPTLAGPEASSKFPGTSYLRHQENSTSLKTDFCNKSAEERRGCLRKSMSLPEGNGVSTNANTNTGLGKNNGKNSCGSAKKSTPSLIRSTSLQHSRSSSNSNSKTSLGRHESNTKHKSVKSTIKKPILDMTQTKLRPRTAPSNHSTNSTGSTSTGSWGSRKLDGNSSDNHNKRSGGTTSYNRRQPLKALQLPVSNVTQERRRRQDDTKDSTNEDSEQKHQGRHERKLIRSDSSKTTTTTIATDMKKVVSWEKNLTVKNTTATSSDTKTEEDGEETLAAPKKHSFRTLKNLPSYLKLLQQPRRTSISVDDDSLLKFTTASVAAAASSGIEETEHVHNVSGDTTTATHNESPKCPIGVRVQEVKADASTGGVGGISVPTISTIKNTKKREECLKIYDKMMKVGCNVRLQTIFRGMMSPVEYREFITAAEASVQRLQATEDDKATEETEEIFHSEGKIHGMNKLTESTELQPIETN